MEKASMKNCSIYRINFKITAMMEKSSKFISSKKILEPMQIN